MAYFWHDDFESPANGWFMAGGAGYDYGKGYARTGAGNAWVRGTHGWNAINRFHDIQQGKMYRLGAWLRVSPELTDGYMSVREARELNGNGAIIQEVKLQAVNLRNQFPGQDKGYRYEYFDFGATTNRVLLYIGLWGMGRDDWIQIDGVDLGEKPH